MFSYAAKGSEYEKAGKRLGSGAGGSCQPLCRAACDSDQRVYSTACITGFDIQETNLHSMVTSLPCCMCTDNVFLVFNYSSL